MQYRADGSDVWIGCSGETMEGLASGIYFALTADAFASDAIWVYIKAGQIVTLTLLPDEGYKLDCLTVTDSKGNKVELTHKGGNKYTFLMPAGQVKIEVLHRKSTGKPAPALCRCAAEPMVCRSRSLGHQ